MSRAGLLAFAIATLSACRQTESRPQQATATATAAASTVATTTPTTAPPSSWTTAYGPPLMTGTELRALVPFQGKLFAGVGYWKDSAADDPALPGARVVLDGANAAWRVDLQLDDVLAAGPQAGKRR